MTDRRSAHPRIPSRECRRRDRRRHTHVGARQLRHLAGEKPEGADHPEPDRSASRGRVEDVRIERQLRVLAERQPRVVVEGDFQPRRVTGRHDLVEKTDELRPSARGGATTRSARLPLYAADRADRLLRRDLITGEARKKRHRNDESADAICACPSEYHQTNSGTTRARAQCRRMLLRRRGCMHLCWPGATLACRRRAVE